MQKPRNYMRHPSDIPIEVTLENENQTRQQLNNFSEGGLAFFSQSQFSPGQQVRVCIGLVSPSFEVLGVIKWCRPKAHQFEIGFEFLNMEDEFKARMVEQICHIEHYKKEVLQNEGRQLSGEQAAFEWIDKYAGIFPRTQGAN